MRKSLISAVAALFCALFLTIAAEAAPVPEKVDAGEVRVLQERIMADPAIMKLVHDLRDDPDIRSVLEDPAMREALEGGDVGKLLQDPRFMKLLSNPLVKEIGKQLE